MFPSGTRLTRSSSCAESASHGRFGLGYSYVGGRNNQPLESTNNITAELQSNGPLRGKNISAKSISASKWASVFKPRTLTLFGHKVSSSKNSAQVWKNVYILSFLSILSVFINKIPVIFSAICIICRKKWLAELAGIHLKSEQEKCLLWNLLRALDKYESAIIYSTQSVKLSVSLWPIAEQHVLTWIIYWYPGRSSA